MTWTSAFGRACGWLLKRIVHGLALTRISPNALTFFGLVINTAAAVLFGLAGPDNQARMFRWAAATIIGAGIFDMVDGRVARATGQVTQFGAFFDSVIDRYSDLALFFGLLVYYARAGRFFYIVLVAVVMTGSVMVSYTRARAESLIGSCKVGFMERPERIVLVIIGALFNRMAPVLWVIAVLSNITVVHRILYTYQQTRERDAEALKLAAAKKPASREAQATLT
jgi:CDP-diacylglycerol--glycerol-3-phosphate 3-phosphatidyltransferase